MIVIYGNGSESYYCHDDLLYKLCLEAEIGWLYTIISKNWIPIESGGGQMGLGRRIGIIFGSLVFVIGIGWSLGVS